MSGEDALKGASRGCSPTGAGAPLAPVKEDWTIFVLLVIELCCKSKIKYLGSKTHRPGC